MERQILFKSYKICTNVKYNVGSIIFSTPLILKFYQTLFIVVRSMRDGSQPLFVPMAGRIYGVKIFDHTQ